MFWNKKKDLKSIEALEIEAKLKTFISRIESCEQRLEVQHTKINRLRSQLNSYLVPQEESEEEKEKVTPKEKEEDGFGFFRIGK